METEPIISEGQAEANTLAGVAAAPKGTGTSVDAGALSLKELNAYLGKTYPDKETALKSLKDTFSFVGRKMEAATPQPTTSPDVEKRLKEMSDELFYSKNPQYDTPEYRKVISKMGENPAEVVLGTEFKTIFDKTTGYDKIQKSKTVLESNPRIGQLRSKIQDAAKSAKANDYATADSLAVAAVLEAYELK